MFELKRIHLNAVPAALKRAERYRLLNEPREAESICRDVLAVDPENQEAAVMLLLTLTDQFVQGFGVALADALAVLERIRDPYEKAYYTGLVHERWAKAQLRRRVPGHAVMGWLQQALAWYERAESMAPSGNDEALLRWNACVRLIQSDEQLRGSQKPAAPGPDRLEMPLE